MSIAGLYSPPQAAQSATPSATKTNGSSRSQVYSAPLNRPIPVSFELFPPRQPALDSPIWAGVERLIQANPAYVSVTFGANGKSQDASLEALSRLRTYQVPTLAHLTCVERSRTQLADLIKRIFDLGVRDILALRGDPPKGQSRWQAPEGGLNYASELVHLIRETAASHLDNDESVDIGVAAYPAGGIQSRLDALSALAQKEAAGADYAITQVFFDARDYQSLLEATVVNGISLPIVPGIIPFTDLPRLQRLQQLTGVPVPARLQELLSEPDARLRFRQGVKETMTFIDQVVAAGAPGLHLYTFNRTRPALDILKFLRLAGSIPRDPQTAEQQVELLAEAAHRITLTH
ncbi:hypothetical protein BSR28_04920 [Boudabousia liubingyangii]|uniref:methylenetetrahydrofolate reductase n=1 Tax=Boudabousia liubingyangii TaxID=1921764 RepID=UPI00093DFD2D|nr:methylenetetrahydrofolate reductase [Boudabousia liubingyangii]OKL46785.1 hypothetical protein BSR28_04920 [Boudabousia liubingyangii]